MLYLKCFFEIKVACLMEFYIIMVIELIQTALQGVLATEAHGIVNLRNATLILARLIQMDTSIHLMELHMITKEPVNMC